ncbi:SRPBCC family protein [uncultured Cellulomonas sp.]|uniref:SRPBCC family protein n=1 Tax=uncultured Cellulomonas sp. TaxID=189682 RepID=UPI00261CE336|nr:SRPBCC family protein [uncultured Cellulomonas sp.]
MTTTVEKTILVNVPVSVAYNQWTQFEEFPHFMGGVTKVTQETDDRLHWVAEIAGVKRQWEAKILEQVPDHKVAWAATEGATNAGAVTFEDLGGGQCRVHLHLEYEPEGLVEKVGDKLNIVENQAEGDLERFKAFIEDEGYASGAWRGTLNAGAGVDAGVEHASASRGSSGKAGISGTAAAVGVGVAAAATAAALAGKKHAENDTEVQTVDTTPAPVAQPVASTPATSTPAASTPPVTGAVPDPVEPVRLEDDREEQPGTGGSPANPVVEDPAGPDPVLGLGGDDDRDRRA